MSHLCKKRHRKKGPQKFSKTHFSRTAYYNFDMNRMYLKIREN